MDTLSGPASRRARWHETLAKFDLTVVYVPGKDNTVADCLSSWAYPASKGMTDVSAHGDEGETAEAKRIIEMERLMEEGVLNASSSWLWMPPSERGWAERSEYSPLMELSPTSTSSLSLASRMTGPTTTLSLRPLRPIKGL